MSAENPEMRVPAVEQGEDGSYYVTLPWYEFFSQLTDELADVQDAEGVDALYDKITAGTKGRRLQSNAAEDDFVLVGDAVAVSGTNALTGSIGLDGYNSSQIITIKVSATNTGAVTLDLDGLGSKAVTLPDGTALSAGALEAENLYQVWFNGTEFELLAGGIAAADVSFDDDYPLLGAENVQAAGDALADRTRRAYTKIQQVDTSLPVASIDNPSLSRMSDTRAVFVDVDNKELRIYNTDGTNWTLVSSKSVPNVTQYASVAGLTSSTFAFIDRGGDNQLRTYELSGGSISQVGNSLTIPTGGSWGSVAITAMTATRIAYLESTSEELRAYDWDGTDWAMVGTAYPLPGSGAPALAALTSVHVVQYDSFGEIRTFAFRDNGWSKVGSDFNIASNGPGAFAVLTTDSIVFIDSQNGYLMPLVWTGNGWKQSGPTLSISGINRPAMTAMTDRTVAFIDDGNKELRTYGFDFYAAALQSEPFDWYDTSDVQSESGYYELPNGAFEAYGKMTGLPTGSAKTVSVTYPVGYESDPVVTFDTVVPGGTATTGHPNIDAESTTGVDLLVQAEATAVHWRAIGTRA